MITVYAFGIDNGRLIVNAGQDAGEAPPAGVTLAYVLGTAKDVFRATGEGVVVLGAEAATQLGFPEREPSEARRQPAGVELLHPARAEDWRVSGLSAWMTLWAPGRPTVHVAVWPWLAESAQGSLSGFLGTLTAYHALVGGSYHTTPGVAGVGLLRDRYAPGAAPYWAPSFDGCEAIRGTADDAAGFMWTTPSAIRCPAADHVHGYDVNRQYLSAAANAELAVGQLGHTGRIRFDQTRAGYWLISPQAWNVPHMPHPAGGGPRRGGMRGSWVTTPTMRLLNEIADHGFIAGPDVIDSWTADKSARIMRPWAEAIRDGLNRAERITEPAFVDRLKPAEVIPLLKQTYRETVGMLGRPGGRVYRPDWRHTIAALARANLYRRLWSIGHRTGRWPRQIKADAVYYASHDPDPIATAETLGLPIGPGGGQFKILPADAPAEPAGVN